MFTLNLLFDINQDNGIFSGDATTHSGPLYTSMNWLRLKNDIEPEPANPNPPAFNPERPGIWEDLLEADTLLVPSMPLSNNKDPANIAIRVVPDPDPGSVLTNPELQLVVSFGRPAKAHQKFGSPFHDNNGATPATLTTFVFGPKGMNTSAGWFFHLGTIRRRPTKANVTQRYEFSIGVIVTEGPAGARRTRHYGQDPEMDIGL
jgi:hypothetical protein